jgi:hypothetical protein
LTACGTDSVGVSPEFFSTTATGFCDHDIPLPGSFQINSPVLPIVGAASGKNSPEKQRRYCSPSL